jgi:hypothetical protein
MIGSYLLTENVPSPESESIQHNDRLTENGTVESGGDRSPLRGIEKKALAAVSRLLIANHAEGVLQRKIEVTIGGH